MSFTVQFVALAKLGSNVPISGTSTVLTTVSFTKEITSPSGAEEVDKFSVSSGRKDAKRFSLSKNIIERQNCRCNIDLKTFRFFC